MIRILELDPTKKEVVSADIEHYTVGGTLSWIDCYKPTEKELQTISEKTGIPTADLKESIDPDKRPQVVAFENYSQIVFRGPYQGGKEVHTHAFNKDKSEVHTSPIAIFLFKNDVLTIYDEPMSGVEKFRSLPMYQLTIIFRKGGPRLIYRFMDAVVNDFFDVMDSVEGRIDALEDEVLHNVANVTTKSLFLEKRTLIYSHRALIANRDVVSAIEKQYLKEFKEEDLRLFRNLYNDVAQLIDLTNTYRDILTSIFDMFLSSVNNNLNKIMKTLTALSAFVLIPTLISSIYGMNFHDNSPWNMPELYWKYGYPFALGLILLSVVITFIWFKKRRWL